MCGTVPRYDKALLCLRRVDLGPWRENRCIALNETNQTHKLKHQMVSLAEQSTDKQNVKERMERHKGMDGMYL